MKTRIPLGRVAFEESRLFAIAGPCVMESDEVCLRVAETLAAVADRLGMAVAFKSSFDKANRTSGTSYRGPGMEVGLKILERVKSVSGLPVVTDVHEPSQATIAAEVADMLQIPAFLCRQTDLIRAAGATGRPVNLKKGQFASPQVMHEAVRKARDAGAGGVAVTERGAFFGYDDLVVDMRFFSVMRGTDALLIFDATHSVQRPAGLGDRSGGRREFVRPLALAAVAAGADGLFIETHPNPEEALCDGPVMLPLDSLEALLRRALAVRAALDDAR